MGSLRALRLFSASSAALTLAIASPEAFAFHKKTYVPVYAAQAPTTFAAPVAAQAPTVTYYTQTAAAAPTVAAAPAATAPVQLFYSTTAAAAPSAAAGTAAAAAPEDTADETSVLTPTLRAALIVDLRQSLRKISAAGGSDTTMSDWISDLREQGVTAYQKLVGGNGDMTQAQKDDLNALLDQVVAEALNRPSRHAPAPYYPGQVVTPAAYVPAYSAPTVFMVQPVVPVQSVQLLAPIQKKHHLLHPHKN